MGGKGRVVHRRGGEGGKGKGKEGRTGAPFNLLPPGATDVVTPLRMADYKYGHLNVQIYYQRCCVESTCMWLQRVSEGSSGVRRLPIDVLWSWIHGRNNTGATSLRLQVLLVLLCQVQHVHQESRRLSLPMKQRQRHLANATASAVRADTM